MHKECLEILNLDGKHQIDGILKIIWIIMVNLPRSHRIIIRKQDINYLHLDLGVEYVLESR